MEYKEKDSLPFTMNGTIKQGYNYTPLHAWSYLGLSLLFTLPFIGFILTIVFSIVMKQINIRNYARYFLILYLLGLFIVIFIGIFWGWDFFTALYQFAHSQR